MTNIYYKTNKQNNNYSLLTYADVGAAAASHHHLISDIVMPNFQYNGCMGQNILNLYNSNCEDLLFYVPHTHSDLVYGKQISKDIATVRPVVPHLNHNKTFTQTEISGSNNNLNLPLTTAYKYNGIGTLLPRIDNDLLNNCYYYPITIEYVNNCGPITITFNLNIDNTNYHMTIQPITNTSSNATSVNNIFSYIIQEFTNTDFGSIGLVIQNKQIIGIYFNITNIILEQQIEITNMIISTQNNDIKVNIKQNYVDYYDTSTIPLIENAGGLGPIIHNQTNYNQIYENDMIRYYRSFRLHNLLTWGQSITFKNLIVPGYCSVETTRNKGYFVLDIPYMIDPDVKNTDIRLATDNNQNRIWALGGGSNELPFSPTPGASVNSNITYTVDSVFPNRSSDGLSGGRIAFTLSFPAISTAYVGYYTPLKLNVKSWFKVSVIDLE